MTMAISLVLNATAPGTHRRAGHMAVCVPTEQTVHWTDTGMSFVLIVLSLGRGDD